MTIDASDNEWYWGSLKELFREHLDNVETFIQYYEQNLDFWTLRGLPRNVFLYDKFADTLVESANSVVQRENITNARSTMRAIYIAAASHDDTIRKPSVLVDAQLFPPP